MFASVPYCREGQIRPIFAEGVETHDHAGFTAEPEKCQKPKIFCQQTMQVRQFLWMIRNKYATLLKLFFFFLFSCFVTIFEIQYFHLMSLQFIPCSEL